MKKLIIVAGVLLMFGSCYNDKYEKLYPASTTVVVTCDTTSVSFAKDIMPIITANCAISGGCHDAAGMAVSGFDFTTYDGISSQASYKILINDINGTPAKGHNAMPLNLPKISQCDINKMTAWVDQGALNN